MTVAVIPENRGKIEAAFWQFHREHPEVYDALRELAFELLDRGYERFGIATIYEVARYRSMIRSDPGSGFKLNNNFRAYYARLLMENEPRLAGIFNTRSLGEPHHVAP